MKTYNLNCEILSPIHIGTGDEIDPLNYIIKGNRFFSLSLGNYIAAMSDEERVAFEALIDKGNLIELRKYVAEHVDPERNSLFSVEVTPEIISLYNDKVRDIQNQLLISPFIRSNGENRPLIPGSSFKGALRTAIISELAKTSNLPKPKDFIEENEFEGKLLSYRDGKNDPFRGIKIRDKTLPNDSTIIREVRNVSKKNGGSLQSNDIQIICELSNSAITGHPVEFEMEVSLDDTLFATGFLNRTLTMEQIVKACKNFYLDKMNKEHEKFYKNSEIEEHSRALLNTPLDENSFIIRIGRFSGVESVTLDNFRNPRPPGNNAVWGTTRNLAEGRYPMGWMKVTIY